jgi:hypothetical protein
MVHIFPIFQEQGPLQWEHFILIFQLSEGFKGLKLGQVAKLPER